MKELRAVSIHLQEEGKEVERLAVKLNNYAYNISVALHKLEDNEDHIKTINKLEETEMKLKTMTDNYKEAERLRLHYLSVVNKLESSIEEYKIDCKNGNDFIDKQSQVIIKKKDEISKLRIVMEESNNTIMKYATAIEMNEKRMNKMSDKIKRLEQQLAVKEMEKND